MKRTEPFQGSNRARILDLWRNGKTVTEIAKLMHEGKPGRPDYAQVVAALDRYEPTWRDEKKE